MTVTTQRNLPAQFVEDLGEDLAKQITAQSGVPVVSTGIAGISQQACLLYTSPSPRDGLLPRMPSSA